MTYISSSGPVCYEALGLLALTSTMSPVCLSRTQGSVPGKYSTFLTPFVQEEGTETQMHCSPGVSFNLLRLVQESSLFCVSLSSSFLGILLEFIFPEPFHFENTDYFIYHKKMSGCLKRFPSGPFRAGYIFRY